MMTGLDAGRVFTIDYGETALGRDPQAHVCVSDPLVSWSHARILRAEGAGVALEDLGSTNGTFVDGRRIAKRKWLRSGARVQLGPSLVMRFSVGDADEESFQRGLYESTVRDALTGAFNRRYFDRRLACEQAYALRSEGALAVLMIDVDNFKSLNDTYGHRAGDELLRVLARELCSVLRTEDVLARWAGDEFVVLARNATPEAAAQLAERLRLAAHGAQVVVAPGVGVAPSISVGVASLCELEADEGPAGIVARADEQLYGAKLSGRDCVCTGE
jgi:diguanylate cyclase (GGDEF)-like protein